MNIKRFDHPEFRTPVVKALKKGISEISPLWMRRDEEFVSVSVNAPKETLVLFERMMDKVSIAAKQAQVAIAKGIKNCIRKYQKRVRFLEGRSRSRRVVARLRVAKARLRAIELKDKEDREILIKSRSVDIDTDMAEFWAEKVMF